MKYASRRQKKVKPKVTITKRGGVRNTSGASKLWSRGIFTIKKTVTKKKHRRSPKL